MQLRFAVFEDPDRTGLGAGESRWIARGLSYDFIGESISEEGAIQNLLMAIATEYEFAKKDGRKPFEGLPKTPASFIEWVKRELPERVVVPEKLARVLPEAWMIEAMGREREHRLH